MRQPDPVSKPWSVPVAPTVLAGLEQAARQHVDTVDLWPWLKVRMTERIEAGRQKYGTLLEMHNGRDALEDAWQEAADCVQYLTQVQMEALGHEATTQAIFLVAEARSLFLKLSRALWDREHAVSLEEPRSLEPGQDQVVYGPTPDRWTGWRGASEPE